MNGDRADAHFLAGAGDPQRDFPAIGDEDFVEHQATNILPVMAGLDPVLSGSIPAAFG
jgi:hypothetical protein